MSAGPDCRRARLHIGAEPHDLPADVVVHVEACAECRRFRDETLSLDGRVHAALELSLSRFRRAAPPARRFALAASVVLALVLAGGIWLLRPAPALAGEVVAHVLEEEGSWSAHEPLAPAAVAEVLRQAGVHFDTSLPIVYGYACPFRGQRVAHFVVQTASGPLTVMLLPNDRVASRTGFSEHGMQGVLLPAGAGSVAVLSRGGEVPGAMVDAIVSGVR